MQGKTELAATYRSKAASVARAINAKFLNETTGAYAVSPTFPENHRPGGVKDVAAHKASQAGQGMVTDSCLLARIALLRLSDQSLSEQALFEGIVPEDLRKNALGIMVENARASEWILQRPSPNYPKSNQTTGGPGAHMTAGTCILDTFASNSTPAHNV